MANIKSAKKRILVNETKAARNKAIRSKVAANAALLACISEIDKACTKGVYHKNTASRKVSRLTKAVNAIA